MTHLFELAHARAGDKGDTSILMLAPYLASDFETVRRCLTNVRVAEHFAVPLQQVTVLPSPGLFAFTVVITGLLDGGVTRSGRIDPHGKTVSSHLLELEVES